MNYYQILGISNNANEQEIKKAYRTKVKKLHPDLNPNINESAIIEVTLAYETLSNELLRKKYDMSLASGFEFKKQSNVSTKDLWREKARQEILKQKKQEQEWEEKFYRKVKQIFTLPISLASFTFGFIFLQLSIKQISDEILNGSISLALLTIAFSLLFFYLGYILFKEFRMLLK